MKAITPLLALWLMFPKAVLGESSPVMIRLVDPLDEPEFYCVDIPGFRENVQLQAPLMAHTLKRFGSADEMWAMDYPSEGQIYASEYGLCIEAASAEPGVALLLKEPSDSPLQRFKFAENGYIALVGNPDLGFAVVEGTGNKAGGGSHLRRDLSLNSLSEADPSFTKWKLIKSAISWPE